MNLCNLVCFCYLWDKHGATQDIKGPDLYSGHQNNAQQFLRLPRLRQAFSTHFKATQKIKKLQILRNLNFSAISTCCVFSAFSQNCSTHIQPWTMWSNRRTQNQLLVKLHRGCWQSLRKGGFKSGCHSEWEAPELKSMYQLFLNKLSILSLQNGIGNKFPNGSLHEKPQSLKY